MLLVWRNSFFVLNLRLHVVDRVGNVHLQSDGLARQRFDEYLRIATHPQAKRRPRVLGLRYHVRVQEEGSTDQETHEH